LGRFALNVVFQGFLLGIFAPNVVFPLWFPRIFSH
jgi:hypothetical protein